MKKWIFISLFFYQASLAGILPPLYEGIRELKEILNDQRLTTLLQSGDVIEEIKKTDVGYLIITNKQQLAVDVAYQPVSHPGPSQYKLIFHTPIVK